MRISTPVSIGIKQEEILYTRQFDFILGYKHDIFIILINNHKLVKSH